MLGIPGCAFGYYVKTRIKLFMLIGVTFLKANFRRRDEGKYSLFEPGRRYRIIFSLLWLGAEITKSSFHNLVNFNESRESRGFRGSARARVRSYG
jgi:hypothetical protein